MSTTPIGVTSTQTSTGSLLQITGLSSGLDTNAIITAEMAIDRMPETQLKNQQTGLGAQKSLLTSIQTSLQTLALNIGALGDTALWANSQAVSSSDATRVSATMGPGGGAGVGGYQVSVSQLANSSQRTFTYASPAAAENITIDGHQTQIAAGASIDDFVSAVNSDASATVYAAKTDTGTVVLSSRASGAPAGAYIQIGGDTQNALTEKPASARPGQDANFSLDGGVTTLTSSTNTVSSAIGGVVLQLNAVTTATGPITINVGAPGPNTTSIQAAVKSMVDSYNSIVDQVQSELTTKTSTSDPTVGTLFGDSELTSLLGNMRQAIYTAVSGLTGVSSLADIGVSTGAASGSATFSQDAVDGKLTIDSTKLANAIQANPTGVKAMLQSWSSSFAQVVNNEAQSGGTLDARIQGDTAQSTDIADQISSLETMLADRQTALQAQFAALEATLSQNQAQGSWLTSQINSLPGWTG